MTKSITRQLVSASQRIKVTTDIFGIQFSMHIEPYLYSITANITSDYTGGFWHFFTLSNGGFYMAPNDDILFDIACYNGYEGKLTADALGITACLYTYSHLSFRGNPILAKPCAEQYHLLREYMLEHAEARGILGAID